MWKYSVRCVNESTLSKILDQMGSNGFELCGSYMNTLIFKKWVEDVPLTRGLYSLRERTSSDHLLEPSNKWIDPNPPPL
jgi:hypothetical protein